MSILKSLEESQNEDDGSLSWFVFNNKCFAIERCIRTI